MKNKIRIATNEDLQEIHRWLIEQKNQDIECSFLCNWNLTLKQHELFVFIDDQFNKPVAYMWPNFGILEVKNSHRRSGIGTELVKYGLDRIIEDDEDIAIRLECEPIESIPFWKKMGFTIYNNKYAYKLNEDDLEIPECGIPVDVEINFYPEDKIYSRNVVIDPIKIAKLKAVKDDLGTIWLPERVAIFTELKEWNGDPVVEIIVNGKRHCLAKAKYLEAKQCGVDYSTSCFFLEMIMGFEG